MTVPADKASPTSFLRGGGEMGERIRRHDWSRTPLGPPEAWPRSLKTAVRILLTSSQPFWIGWGPELTYLYNDPYLSIIGGKHPHALGQPFAEVWKEIRDVVGPMAAHVLERDQGTYVEAQLLIMERHGYREETYYTYSYSPIPGDDGAPAGLICANTDETRRVQGERQLATLRELAARTAPARTQEEACALAVEALGTNQHDLTFALLYLEGREGEPPTLAAASPGAQGVAAPEAWPLAEVLRTGEARLVPLADLPAAPPTGAWSCPGAQAAVLRITPPSGRQAALVVGLSPFRLLDETYRGLLELLAGQLATAMANAQAYDEERRRAESLAALDRAKTAFFSNVSHEFRTPLTLMLGPLEDILGKPEGEVLRENRELLRVVQRNGQRLAKLVNTLLDFARIEAGRAQASYEPTDLSASTAELASNFRSACERAGLRLEIDCPPLSEPAWIDREMWEKVVLNLVSNAFKFTHEGGIGVRTRELARGFELVVRDSGIGVSAEELPRMFERFHRVESARGRSHEGSGIGLALVQELVRLHGGTIEVESEAGRGTAFTVVLPRGKAHLPQEKLSARPDGSTAARASAFVEEALSWLPAAAAPAPARGARPSARRVLLADDNADLREYARRLLAEHHEVEAVADGEQALAAARARKPDLVVTDAMMPRLDGFGLLRALRADPALSDVPVLVLSARAGEESRLEGLERGADDYLAKPFRARELQVRVEALLQSAEARRRSLATLREADRRKDEFLATLAHELRNPLAPLANGLAILALRGDGDPERAALRAMMQRQLDHLVRLVDDLLEISRITRGRLELRREPVQVATVLRHAAETSEPVVSGAGHALEVDAGDVPLWLDGDPVRLAQILSNLIHNAARYTDPGGRIWVRARRHDGRVALSVRDTGRGIAPEALERIFELFHRPDLAREGGTGGLGVGLALSRRLAEMHGGTLTARSPGPGRGATFELDLPLATAPSSPAQTTPAASADVPPRRVLVVDDNRDAAESLRLLLSRLGADARAAFGGQEALDAIEAFAPELVLLDLGMPGIDGLEVARRVRAQGRALRLVALTGWGQEQDRERTRQAGFDDHLVKPPDLDTLRALVAAG